MGIFFCWLTTLDKMAKVVKFATKTAPAILGELVTYSRPKLAKFLSYAQVELRPPTLKEIPEISNKISHIANSYKTGAWKELTIKQIWANTLVGAEIGCWFFVGECFGKGSIIGYEIDGAVNWETHF